MDNQSCFERCDHDRQNPYVMISREMLHDKSISPKAKGVLSYLLSLPPNWKIYHCQLQEALNVGEDYINSAIQELIDNGYADRTRHRVKGIFQPYTYKIRELKKCSPNPKIPDGEILQSKMPPQCGFNQTGFTGPGNPGVIKKEGINNIKQQQAPTVHNSAAASFSIHPSLEPLPISQSEKEKISKHRNKHRIEHAVGWATKNVDKLKRGLAATIKWILNIVNESEIPQISIDPEKIIEENRSYVVQFDDMKVNPQTRISVGGMCVEFVNECGGYGNIAIRYDNKNFRYVFGHTMRKFFQ